MIWLVGNKGMLGTEVESLLKAAGLSYTATDIEIDITRPDEPARFVEKLAGDPAHRLEWIVNCSAYTAVDAAEDESQKAFAVNALGPRSLAIAARESGAALLHISTDYVFDGFKEGAYTEDDAVNPLSAYGKSKLEGEREIAAALDRHVILRTAWLYAGGRKNFVTTMLNLFRTRDTVKVVEDQWGSPTYARDLAGAVLTVVQRRGWEPGIYHYSNDGRTNWFEFARQIHTLAARRGLAPAGVAIVPIKADQYPTKARRPANSYLSKAKFVGAFDAVIRPWQTALEACFEEEISIS